MTTLLTMHDDPPGRDPQPRRPRWYHEPIMWLVVGLPLSAVIAGIITLVIAARSFDGLVADDYYKQGLEINRRLERDRAAAALDLDVSFALSHDARLGRLHVTGNETFDPPSKVDVRFAHSTLAGLDRDLTVKAIAPGLYEFAAPPLPAGRWTITVSTETWRISDSVFRDLEEAPAAQP